ncbi:response regulator [Pedobacter sp.]
MRNKITVAFADDHQVTRSGLRADMEAFENISVEIMAENGLALIELIEQCAIAPDVCLIDIDMPVMDGFELQARINERWPSIRTIAYTYYDNENYISRMISLGVNGYLLKTASAAEVATAIQTVNEGGFYYSPIADRKKFIQIQNRAAKPVQFSQAEIDLLKMSGTNLSYAEMAAKLSTTPKAVTSTRDRLFIKLGINSRIELFDYALENGFVIRKP